MTACGCTALAGAGATADAGFAFYRAGSGLQIT
jgi:hypothetical protein